LLSGCRDSVEDQANKLGDREFTTVVWATASSLQRGEMTASLLRKHDLKRSNGSDIVALLGHPAGYYDYDTNPAYVVGPTTVESVYTKGYLLVFETDKENGKVERIFFVPDVE
jgi:hypothetical protein